MERLRSCLGTLALCSGIGIAPCHGQADERIYEAVIIDFKSYGSFWTKTTKELGSNEARLLVMAACAYFGTDCTKQSGYLQRAAQIISKLDQQQGDVYRGAVHAAAGYEVCRIFVNSAYRDWSITGGATFNGSLTRNNQQNGLFWYGVVPGGGSRGQWFNFEVVLEQVPRGTANQYGCWPSGIQPFLCGPRKGEAGGANSCRYYPSMTLHPPEGGAKAAFHVRR